MNQDTEHLRLLSIFHYVVAGAGAFLSFFPLLYTVLGIVFVVLSRHPSHDLSQTPPPAALGWIFVGLGVFLCLLGLIFSLFIFLAGRALGNRQHYNFVFVVACVECLFVPFGTVLGVFTLIVLSRPSAKALFLASPPVEAAAN